MDETALAPARRISLREYQAQLIERVQAAAQGDAGRQAHQLGVAIGEARYLVDLLDAGEIVPPVAITPVPLTQPWYLGLANVRGNLVGVIDLARYFGFDESAQAGSSGRLVTFAPRLGLNCALLVSRVYGLRHAADMQASGERLRDVDANEWMPLSLAALAREERFLQVGL
ncbi:chemotaxis protein CheW [Massilia horti]|uniref:Chemotaxis protein CheW n=1 Tax=Massilia horti TaxID=2562153 RepID=A0A4Y9T328_9BURK|nr:chemotaxis protein CheW [Massilia horti]TFW34002.1 chemotaxis protein CheW [Massilia horti]